MGWGLTGFCPGPAMANLVLLPQAALEVLFIIIGQLLTDFGLKRWKSFKEKQKKDNASEKTSNPISPWKINDIKEGDKTSNVHDLEKFGNSQDLGKTDQGNSNIAQVSP
ncbi:unnamed protein product [Blepharisma stoltei]|uniref:Uncharacterized protein n=1 Tax=Blepharisma stoltei TaxID=1481888 RepID=A0AAU9JQS9_9CILI|nr:unnamed protein product [Blepharisma stoltei]